jgi:hypothetical protein
VRIRLGSPGFWGSGLLALAGVWLLGAPQWVGFQAPGAALTAAARDDLVTGAVLLGVSVAGLFAQVAFGLRDLVAAGTPAAPESEGAE